ncbi:MAG: DUF362 domain-containing protein [Planctomycetes bacterium]|nr:DUF362 domain-containing protein [Planctomycetota bacterium]
MAGRCTRRAFLGAAGAAALGAVALPGCSGGPAEGGPAVRIRPHPAAEEWKTRVGLATGGDDPARNVRTAVEKLCGPDGARTFVRQGDIVVVKPNIGWGQVPEMGATVNPAVVAATVRMCLDAGAAKVKVFDNSVGTDSKCYEFSGIEKAARDAGADVFLCARHRFRTLAFDDPRCTRLTEWPIYEDVLTADVLVNVAVAKTHNLCAVTLCMKNLMGTQGGDRGKMHQELGQNLADLNVMIRPTLNILDATRVMIAGGPSGGRRDQVVDGRTIVCGTSSVTVDCWAADPAHLPWPQGLRDAASLDFLARGEAAGLGTADPAKIIVAA